MKKIFLIELLIFLFCFENIFSENTTRFDGDWTLAYDTSTNRITLKGNSIRNKSARNSGNLEYRIYFTEKQFNGEENSSGYMVFKRKLSSLNSGAGHNNFYVEEYCDAIPPKGTFYIVVILVEDGYLTDYLTFDKTWTIK